MSFFDVIGSIFRPIADVIDHVLPSGDAKIALQQKVLEAQMAAAAQAMDYEKQLLDSQAQIVKAEAQGTSWLQRNWRPMVALFLTGLVGAYWFGFTPPNLSPASVADCFSLVKICLGGYVVGRSAEKIAAPAIGAVVQALKK